MHFNLFVNDKIFNRLSFKDHEILRVTIQKIL